MARDFGSTNGIVLTKSTNGGVSFSPPVTVTTASGCQGANIVVNADHSLSVFWYQTGSIQTRRSVVFRATFSAPVTVSTLVTTGTNGDMNLTRSTTNSGRFRSNAFPSVQANPTVPGNIYVAWADKGTGADKANIKFSQSTDFGATWSPAMILNTDGTTAISGSRRSTSRRMGAGFPSAGTTAAMMPVTRPSIITLEPPSSVETR